MTIFSLHFSFRSPSFATDSDRLVHLAEQLAQFKPLCNPLSSNRCLRSRPLWNEGTSPPANRAPHCPDAGEESSGMAPNISGNVQSAAATIEEGANEESSFMEMLEESFSTWTTLKLLKLSLKLLKLSMI